MDQQEEIKDSTISTDKYIVVGDIGGTNFRLRLSREVEVQDKVQYFEIVEDLNISKSLYQKFAIHIDQMLETSNVDKSQLKSILIACTGYQEGVFYGFGRDVENLQAIKDHYPHTNVRFINDAEGMAQALIYQDEIQKKNKDLFIQLKHPKTEDVQNQNQKVKFLYSMGTGLGTALVLPYPNGDSFKYFVSPSEGWASYCTINDLDPRQDELGKYMFKVMKTKSNLNRFSKGNGIFHLYNFLKEKHPDLENPQVLHSVKKAIKEQAKAKTGEKVVVEQQKCITYAAVHEIDPLCQMTIDFLIETVATCLVKFGMTVLPMGGIYIGGGVSNYLSSYIEKKQDIFWKHFLIDNVISESILTKIPIYILRENPTLDALEAALLNESQ